jgi:hypothetical protein
MTTCSLLDRSILFLMTSPWVLKTLEVTRQSRCRASTSKIGEFSRKSFRIGLEMSRGLTRTVIRYPTRKTNAGVSYWNLYFAR